MATTSHDKLDSIDAMTQALKPICPPPPPKEQKHRAVALLPGPSSPFLASQQIFKEPSHQVLQDSSNFPNDARQALLGLCRPDLGPTPGASNPSVFRSFEKPRLHLPGPPDRWSSVQEIAPSAGRCSPGGAAASLPAVRDRLKGCQNRILRVHTLHAVLCRTCT